MNSLKQNFSRASTRTLRLRPCLIPTLPSEKDPRMEVGRICSDLVAIRSENPPGRTAEVIEYIRTFLDTLGIGSKITRTKTGQNNLITTGTSSRLLFCGHVDVVPALDD